jgi:polysaccharide biosynthesis protein PslH
MKILMLTPYLPYPPNSGGQTRSYNLIKNLSKKHDITLFSLIKEDSETKNLNELTKYCRVKVFKRSKTPWTISNILHTGFSLYPFLVIRNLVPEEKNAIALELEKNKYDLIHAETFYVMPHIPKTDVPVLLVEQTIEYLVYKHYVEDQAPLLAKPLFTIDVAKLRYWETHYWKKAKSVVAMSESDKKEMKKLVPGLKINIVPNGIDTEYFSKKATVDNSTSPRVLYVGNFKWLQNAEAAEILINNVWPEIKKNIPNAVLWIVGKDITDNIKSYSRDDIKISEGIPDIRDAYLNSRVLIAPIEGPGGTRLKILEAMASALPVITTDVGAEGLQVENGKHALITNDWSTMSKMAINIIKNNEYSKEIGEEARKFVKDKYSWSQSSSYLDEIYRSVVNE